MFQLESFGIFILRILHNTKLRIICSVKCTSTKALKGYSQQLLLKYKQISLTVYFEERSRSGSSASSSVFLEKDKLSECLMLIYQWELHWHPMSSWQEN